MMSRGRAKAVAGWLKFLNPQTLKSNLIAASLYLAAWESLREAVIDQLKGFYFIGTDENGMTYSPKYETDVLSRHKSPFRASFLWFLEAGAVNQSDLELADRIREHRNEIAHNLIEFVASGDKEINLELFAGVSELVVKIDQWWIREIEIPTNPDFDDHEIDELAVSSGRMLILGLMFRIAAGDEGEVSKWYHEFAELTKDW